MLQLKIYVITVNGKALMSFLSLELLIEFFKQIFPKIEGVEKPDYQLLIDTINICGAFPIKIPDGDEYCISACSLVQTLEAIESFFASGSCPEISKK